MKINLLKVNQPIGTFYLGVLPASIVSKISIVVQKNEKGGIQREESKDRISKIKKYCSDPDATFPTPIIIALNTTEDYKLSGNELEFNEEKVIGEILDGQHRINGIKEAENINDFDLPVVFMYDLTSEEKAYVFSIINSTQTKVPNSLIYDLFDVFNNSSPQKTCHEMARSLNSDPESPFYKRLKMLGKRQHELESLSQGTFVTYLLTLISSNPQEDAIDIKNTIKTSFGKESEDRSVLKDDIRYPLRNYFISDNDKSIYKIIKNMFTALSNVFPNEWNDPEKYILSKTTGYGALIKSYPYISGLGKEEKDLTIGFFEECFMKFKIELEEQNIELTSKYFSSNESEQRRLSNLIIESIQKYDFGVLRYDPSSNNLINLSEYTYDKSIKKEFRTNFEKLKFTYKIALYRLLLHFMKGVSNDTEIRYNKNFIGVSENLCLYYKTGNSSYRNFYLNLKGTFSGRNVSDYLDSINEEYRRSDEESSLIWVSNYERFTEKRFMNNDVKTLFDEIKQVLNIKENYNHIQLSVKDLNILLDYYKKKLPLN